MMGRFCVIDCRHGIAQTGNDLLNSREAEPLVVVQAEVAAPGIEQLDGGSASGDLGFEIRDGSLYDSVQEIAKNSWVVVEKALGRRETLSRPAFHHVAR